MIKPSGSTSGITASWRKNPEWLNFQFRREHLFTQPDLGTLLDDPVYQGYILPHARAERLETERERQRADEERQRADELAQELAAERAYKEQLHAYLASLGVDLPESLQ